MPIPTVSGFNNNFMMQNPQYSYGGNSSIYSGQNQEQQYNTALAQLSPSQRAAYLAANSGGNPYRGNTYSPTVITNADNIDNKIPKLNQQGNQIAQEVAGNVGLNNQPKEDTSYQDAFSKALGQTETMSQFSESPEQKSLRDMMRSSLDAQTQAALSAIQSQYAAQESALVESQKSTSKGLENVLNLGGSARYAPLSSMGLVDAKNKYDMQTLTELHAKEQAVKAGVLQAQREGNFQLMQKQMNGLEALRKEKIAFATKIAEDMAKQNKTIRDKQIQSTRDSAISDLVNQGITDPNEIMSLLNESAQASGYQSSDFTAEEIGNALKIFKPDAALAGLDSDYKTYSYLKSIGDPSIGNMNYLQYKTAVANATRAPQSEKNINLSSEKKASLLGVGFGQDEIGNIESDVQTYGLNKVLEGITDSAQKKALQAAYGQKEKVTRQMLETTITQKAAYDGLKESYTTDELKQLADDAGLSSFWTGADTDIERFLNSPEAKKIYIDLLYKQYESAGMAE